MTRALTVVDARARAGPGRGPHGRRGDRGGRARRRRASPATRWSTPRGGHVLPGLVNGHTHAAMTLFRGWGDDLPLMEWLQAVIWPAEARLTPDDVYWGTRLAARRDAAHRDRALLGHVLARRRGRPGGGRRGHPRRGELGRHRRRRPRPGAGPCGPEILDQLDAVAAHGPLVTPGLGPHAVYTVSPETLTWIAEVSHDAAVPVQIHLAETEQEVLDCHERHGVGPATLLDRCGLLGPVHRPRALRVAHRRASSTSSPSGAR